MLIMPEKKTAIASLDEGIAIIRDYLKRLPENPGVYRMINAQGDVIYVGKAKALKKRVASYTNPSRLPMRLKRMVAETKTMEFVTTPTEVAALMLESSYIKKFQPTYNVLLRDDKSFPYIYISDKQDYPGIYKYRGARKEQGSYYGPYPSAGAVNKTLIAMHKAFMIRNCRDSQFENRDRPCLQYHIKRCTAPCVGYVSKQDYDSQLKDAKAFLEGKSTDIKETYAERMQLASEELDFERAAHYRDRLRALSYIQMRHDVPVQGVQDADVFAAVHLGKMACIQVFFFRGGQPLGNKPYYIKLDEDEDLREALASFVPQFYENKPVTGKIYLNLSVPEQSLIAEALTEQKEKRVQVITPQKGAMKQLSEWVEKNAREALKRKMGEQKSQAVLLEGLADILGLDEPPARIEVYDNSHVSGTNMVGAMIVAGPDGFNKKAYRKFNIREAGESDDYGMMREVMKRRFSRLIKELEEDPQVASENWPDLVLIDGGAGQLSSVIKILEELELADRLNVVAIAKGPERNAGRETFFKPSEEPFTLPPSDPVMHYLQRLRDEAHRFAISAHRTRRKSDIPRSPLDGLPGVGPKRKKALLQHYGSGKAVKQASIADLASVEGISRALAEKIYAHFHA